MTEQTPIEMAGQRVVDAELLERIASAIAATMYDHSGAIGEGYRQEKYIRWDHADELRLVAERLRAAR